jgi:hypothetical protein
MNDELGRQILEQIRELQTSLNTCTYLLYALIAVSVVALWRHW